jgi:pimeloyl-ACP methyl ester carboxylesterase
MRRFGLGLALILLGSGCKGCGDKAAPSTAVLDADVDGAEVDGAGAGATCSEAQSVPYDLDTGSGTLFGTLELPAGCMRPPVALIHAGSGPTDRDGNSTGAGHNDALKMLAQALAARGIASVRYDKRGIGASAAAGPKDEHDFRFETLVQDATAWAVHLAADPRFSQVAIIGHSEGCLIGMQAGAKSPTHAFVSIAGPGRPAGTVMREQLAQSTPVDLLAVANHIIDQLELGHEVAVVPQPLFPLLRPSVQPYLIGWFRYDPAREQSDLNLPDLVIQGSTDLQVTEQDARLLAADRPQTQVVIVPGMNHVLKNVSGNAAAQRSSYGDPTLPIVAAVPDAIAAFFARVLK